MRFKAIANHEAFVSFRFEFRLMMRLTDPTRCVENLEVTHIGFLEELMQIHPIDDVAGCVDCFSPPHKRCVVLSKHRSIHLNEGPVLPFNDTILLRSVWRRELMSDAHIIEEPLYAGVLEFGVAVASNMLDLEDVVVHDALGEAFEDSLGF